MEAAEVKRVQTNLTKKGYQVGGIDGDFGLKTFHAYASCASGHRQDDALKVHSDALLSQMVRTGIIGRYRMAHFIANIVHECAGFTRMIESTVYSDAARLDALFSNVKGVADATSLIRRGAAAIGNRIYANRNGNGDEASGDGFLYRGRSYLMHTGRANYAALEAATGKPLVKAPQWLERPEIGAIAACAFWDARLLSLAADRNDPRAVREGINGPAKLGLDDCTKIANRLISLWV